MATRRGALDERFGQRRAFPEDEGDGYAYIARVREEALALPGTVAHCVAKEADARGRGNSEALQTRTHGLDGGPVRSGVKRPHEQLLAGTQKRPRAELESLDYDGARSPLASLTTRVYKGRLIDASAEGIYRQASKWAASVEIAEAPDRDAQLLSFLQTHEVSPLDQRTTFKAFDLLASWAQKDVASTLPAQWAWILLLHVPPLVTAREMAILRSAAQGLPDSVYAHAVRRVLATEFGQRDME